ncbi:hypothetical protein JCM10908_000205 [Rhodotorula pacifica]|uniref:uncharacterized protein n=1 Tax=Rhodotorula pacifica TaxID=1495444 RepID=UPI0031744DFC
MPNRTVDDQDIAILYSGPWHYYRGNTNVYNASQWYGGTFASCGDPNASVSGPPCELRFPFRGTYAALYGDSSGTHGVFACRLEAVVEDEPEPEGLWSWYDGGSLWWWTYRHNVTLCAVTVPTGNDYTLVLSVQPDQVRRGIAFDFAVSSETVDPGPVRWSSDFTTAVPPEKLRNTTATPILPSSTANYAAAPSATDGPNNDYFADSGSLSIGLGVGLGLGIPFALCAALALWWHFRRRRRRIEGGVPYRKQGTFEVQSVRHSKGGTPRTLAGEGEFGTDTLVEAGGGEKDGGRWYGRPGHEGTYDEGSIPASPGQYSPASIDFALPSIPDSAVSPPNQRLSYGSPGSPHTAYPPVSPHVGVASPHRPRWSAASGTETLSVLTRDFDLSTDAELDDPATFRER